MARKDYTGWLTKQEAAQKIGVSTKTVEKLAQEKKLQQGKQLRVGRPAIAVYHPGDVQRASNERNPDADAFVLPASAPLETAANAEVARQAEAPAIDPMAAFAQFIRETVNPVDQSRTKLFLTIAEASRYSGLPPICLKRLIKNGKLESVPVNNAGAKRIRRRDLEEL